MAKSGGTGGRGGGGRVDSNGKFTSIPSGWSRLGGNDERVIVKSAGPMSTGRFNVQTEVTVVSRNKIFTVRLGQADVPYRPLYFKKRKFTSLPKAMKVANKWASNPNSAGD